MISIKIDTSGLDRLARDFVKDMQKQKDYAKAVMLTRLARQAAADAQAELPKALDRPTPFTVKSIGWKAANKRTLESVVFIRPVAAAYLAPLIVGGKVRPKRRALLDPTNVPLNAYGNLPRNAIARLRARKDVFSGEVRGVAGLWQRTGRGLKLLVRYQGEVQKPRLFDFAGIVRRSVDKHAPSFWRQAWAEAQRTAR